MEEKSKDMVVIAKENLVAALQAVNRIQISGVDNAKLIYYVSELLRSAEPLAKEESNGGTEDGGRKHS